MLQDTVARLEPLSGPRCIVVTGEVHEHAVRAQLPELGDRLIAEPQPRDSMAAIGLAAAMIERRDPDAILGSFAADHVIRDEPAFRAVVTEAIAVAATGRLVTIGITPSGPATGYGYIRRGVSVEVEGAPNAYAVDSFVEKPDEATAKAYLAAGGYFWNAGMFVVKARVLLDLLARYHPELAAGLRRIATTQADKEVIWAGLRKISIDHAVAEPAAADGQVAVVMGEFPWDDVGDFEALTTLAPVHEGSEMRVLGQVDGLLAEDASGLVVSRSNRMVTVVGLHDIVIVDTPDALLVMSRDRAQQLKSVVDDLGDAGRPDLT